MLLEIEHISKQFQGVRALNDVSFSLGEGELVGLIGPNGSGKTTLFNVVSGFLRPTSGRVRFNGHVITGISPNKIARRGLVRTWQSNLVIADETVNRNIQLFREESSVADNARFPLADIADMLGLKPYLQQQAGSCPHGIQRKLGIAMGLAASPRLLMLDEPLAGLNAAETVGATTAIRAVCEAFRTTVLWVEHNMTAIMSTCTRVVVLSYGNYLADGLPAEIQSNPAVIEAYLGHD